MIEEKKLRGKIREREGRKRNIMEIEKAGGSNNLRIT